MPALTERLLATPTPDAPPAVERAETREAIPPVYQGVESPPVAATQRVCSACYLTESELNRTGLLGCARCYETFAPVIASAAAQLHGVRVPSEWSQPQPRHTVTNPWPTRRGVRIGSK